LTSAGKAYCWGEGQYGQIGDGALVQRLEPTAVAGGTTFAALAAGERTVCALDAAGHVYCWGEDPANPGFPARNTPQRVDTPLIFKSITVGRRYVCGVTTDAATYCWGENGRGQLGVGDTLHRPTPTRVIGGLTLTSINAGLFHTCGLTNDGTAHCWGDNSFSTLGTESLASATQPQRVATTSQFKLLAAGAVHTCGVTTAGETLCWGANRAGQLGGFAFVTYRTPMPTVAGRSFVALRASRANSFLGSTCGIEASGLAYCWGANESGQLGRTGSDFPQCGVSATTVCRYEPEALSLPGVVALEIGQSHACAVTGDGRASCWGENATGELGDGTLTPRATPARLAGTLTFR
jgi:alpha-tubulin suppressor-like RCC1 family protein